jgi:hypothetical protein
MTAPDGSWTVPEIVSECSHVGLVNQIRNNAACGKEEKWHRRDAEPQFMTWQYTSIWNLCPQGFAADPAAWLIRTALP